MRSTNLGGVFSTHNTFSMKVEIVCHAHEIH